MLHGCSSHLFSFWFRMFSAWAIKLVVNVNYFDFSPKNCLEVPNRVFGFFLLSNIACHIKKCFLKFEETVRSNFMRWGHNPQKEEVKVLMVMSKQLFGFRLLDFYKVSGKPRVFFFKRFVVWDIPSHGRKQLLTVSCEGRRRWGQGQCNGW